MNKSNSIMEKIQEYQAPKCEVMELQNEGMLCASLNKIETGGTIGTIPEEPAATINLFDE